ncbi:unnamed protein product [Bursaphelenchus okinawaensis]|uniref:Uncharacterized protein n=1 Tax=Bursaphelenchus okinawaensis TaxID=465554 RepID=A0A811JPY1_9BILA|nr:unnamed protein product [Bursaphelenchus okinawaensis]CAG9077241.1 unnamed protein product [Bursaphelenchus okinawaensis]
MVYVDNTVLYIVPLDSVAEINKIHGRGQLPIVVYLGRRSATAFREHFLSLLRRAVFMDYSELRADDPTFVSSVVVIQ